MKLTDNEKREVFKLIEADKPLPDKYRLLLFDDKREVELIWNGKTNEVTNIVLPFQVIEQVDEPRSGAGEIKSNSVKDGAGKKAGASKVQEGDVEYQGFLFDERGRQKTGWTKKLIWGDNKLILSSLKNGPMREEDRQKQLQQKEKDFITLILKAYRSKPVANFKCFHGKKAGRLVAVGPINLPVTRLFVEEIILECREKRVSRVDILAFEFEMGLFPNIQEEAKSRGIDLALKYIPREVFDRRAVEKNQVVFHDVSFIEVKPHVKKGPKGGMPSMAVELTDFSVFYSQDNIDNVAEAGKIIKVSKDKNDIVTREVLTKKWTDWIDYWSVDFDFESKREIIHVKDEAGSDTEGKPASSVVEMWTGDFIFENEWQSFRTKKERSLELKTPFHECQPGRYKVAVKVVDIFGNDTMKIIEVNVG